MRMKRIQTIHQGCFAGVTVLLFSYFISTNTCHAEGAKPLMEKGWSALVKDSDVEALKYFGLAYEEARKENDTEDVAASLLNMGICSYGVSYSMGLEYCFMAMDEYKKLEHVASDIALTGRCRCLQLISTINSRQGKYRESIALSKEAMAGFPTENDTSGYLGLIYNSLGIAYSNLNLSDSAEYYHRLALTERTTTGNFTYLPGSLISVADIELNHGNKTQSRIFYDRAMAIADSTGNRQAQVSSLLSLGNWYNTFEKNEKETEASYQKACQIAYPLNDKSFYLNVLEHLVALKKKQGDFAKAFVYQEEMQVLKDTLYSWEKQKILKSLEVQFDVSEKDRQLKIVQKEKDIALLTSYLLWMIIGFVVISAAGIILFLRRINKRDKALLQTKEALVIAIEERRKMKERQLQNEIEFKESQLSAMTFQMLQKNELMQELKKRMDTDKNISDDNGLNKIINKGLNHDKEWKDFNSYFESINKNFYTRLKQAYPDISPNDLKICALIKLNLSIKEMAGILNISPDSVKTARYRLRKKLQLNTEDNLTEFILHLG